MVLLTGRLTAKPELKTGNHHTFVRGFVAIQRRKREEADFIPFVAFGKTAEFLCTYFEKGSRIQMMGRLQSGSFLDQEGKKRFTLDFMVQTVEFGEDKKKEREEMKEPTGFLPAEEEADLPF